MKIKANEIDSTSCTVVDGVPEPIINWRLIGIAANDDNLNRYSSVTKEVIFDNKTNSKVTRYTSELEMKATLDWDEKIIECYIEHPTLNNKVMSEKKTIDLTCKSARELTKIFLIINFFKINLDAPILSISYQPNDAERHLIEGRTYSFTCNANAKPNINKLRLFKD